MPNPDAAVTTKAHSMYCYELICVQVTLLESEHQLLRHKVGSHGMQWFMRLLLCSADTSKDDMLTQGYLGQNPKHTQPHTRMQPALNRPWCGVKL